LFYSNSRSGDPSSRAFAVAKLITACGKAKCLKDVNIASEQEYLS
jgi:hypothetical protein